MLGCLVYYLEDICMLGQNNAKMKTDFKQKMKNCIINNAFKMTKVVQQKDYELSGLKMLPAVPWSSHHLRQQFQVSKQQLPLVQFHLKNIKNSVAYIISPATLTYSTSKCTLISNHYLLQNLYNGGQGRTDLHAKKY